MMHFTVGKLLLLLLIVSTTAIASSVSPHVTPVLIPYYAPSVISYKSQIDESKLLTPGGNFAPIANIMRLLKLDLYMAEVCKFYYYNIIHVIFGTEWIVDPCAEFTPAQFV